MTPIDLTRRGTLAGAAAGVAGAITGKANAADSDLVAHIRSATPLVNRERAYQVMDKYGLTGLVAAFPINIYYLSSHAGPSQLMGQHFFSFAVFPRNESAPPTLVISGANLYHLDYRPTWMSSIQVYTSPRHIALGEEFTAEGNDPPANPRPMPWHIREGDIQPRDRTLMAMFDEFEGKTSASALFALKKAVTEAGMTSGKIGFDDPRVGAWLNYVDLPDVGTVDALNIFREIRMVKTNAEIELMTQAAQKNEAALDYAIEHIGPGVTLDEIEFAHQRKWGELEGRSKWLITNVRGLASGRVEKGDFMKIDCVGVYKGYHGDVGRSVMCGVPTDEVARRIAANTKALGITYKEIKPGVSFFDAMNIMRDVMNQEGFERAMSSPHPVGLEHTDLPYPHGTDALDAYNDMRGFQDGMTFTLDVPYHEIGWGTTHVEDVMLVRPHGCEGLSSMDTSLRVRPA